MTLFYVKADNNQVAQIVRKSDQKFWENLLFFRQNAIFYIHYSEKSLFFKYFFLDVHFLYYITALPNFEFIRYQFCRQLFIQSCLFSIQVGILCTALGSKSITDIITLIIWLVLKVNFGKCSSFSKFASWTLRKVISNETSLAVTESRNF